MKIRHTITRWLALMVLASGCVLSGCSHNTTRAPALTNSPDDFPKPPGESFLGKAADTTWNVVSAPVRWVAPGKKRPVAATQPEVYEPGDLIIMNPNGGQWQTATPTQPPPPAATQPK